MAMPREEYTRQNRLCGWGFFTSGEHTLIYRRPDGSYFTAGRHDLVSGAELVGGGHLQPNGLPQIDWCD